MREIKFRAWDKEDKQIIEVGCVSMPDLTASGCPVNHHTRKNLSMKYILMQYTGLKDKKNLTEIYECDILDENGNVKGNIYEMDKGETGFVIQGFGTKTWCETYRRAILLGCKDAE